MRLGALDEEVWDRAGGLLERFLFMIACGWSGDWMKNARIAQGRDAGKGARRSPLVGCKRSRLNACGWTTVVHVCLCSCERTKKK